MAETIASLAVRIGADLSGFEKQMKEFNKTWGKLGGQMQQSGAQIGTAFTAAGGAIAAGLGFAVSAGMEFDAQMSRVGAIAGGTTEDLEAMRQAALDLGASTSKSASEVAIGMELMAAKGYDAQQIIAAMPGVIAAAEASGEDMAMVADTVASALNAFGLEAAEASRVADVLAMSANTSAAGVEDLQYAFKYAAPIANTLGISMEQLAAATGIMTDAGMKGEQAGTTLRAALLRLTDPPGPAAAAMEELGLSVKDAAGNFLPLDQIVGQLATSTANMTDAQKAATLSTIFGTEAVTGMLSLISAGPEKFNTLTTALQNSGGASAETAAKMKDNLAGSMQELSGAVETLQIGLGSALAPAIRAVADVLTTVVNWFNSLSPGMQSVIAYGAALTAGLLILVGVIGFLIAAAGAVISGVTAIGVAMLGTIGIVAAVIAAVALLAFFVIKYWDEIKAFTLAAWEGIKVVVLAAWDFIVELFRTAWSVVEPIITGYWESIKAVWTAAFETIKLLLSAWWETIKLLFLSQFLLIYYIVTGQWDKIGALFQAAKEKLQLVVEKLWEGLKAIWSAASQRITESTSKMWGGIKDVFTNAWNGIKSWFSNVVTDAKDMGVNMIRGMIDGVKSMAASIASAAAEVVSNAINAAKKALGIHSPSRVFMEIGGYTAEGMAIGMEDGTRMIRDAGSLMAGAAVPAAMTGGAGGSHGGTTVIIEMDSRMIAQKTFEQMGGVLRVRGVMS